MRFQGMAGQMNDVKARSFRSFLTDTTAQHRLARWYVADADHAGYPPGIRVPHPGPFICPAMPQKTHRGTTHRLRSTHEFRCAVQSRVSSVGADPTRQLSFQPDVPVAQEGSGDVPESQRDDLPPLGTGRGRRQGKATQPHAHRLGELLQPGLRQQGLPDRGPPRPASAPPVVVRQAQGPGSGLRTLP